jgi:hypothetical protein
MTLEVPCTLAAAGTLANQLPPETRQIIAHSEEFTGTFLPHRITVSVAHVEYQPGFDLSLDGAAAVALSMAGAGARDSHPNAEIVPVKVSGAEARKFSYRHNVQDGEAFLHVLVVIRDRQLWQVSVEYRDAAYGAEADRIIASAALLPAGESEGRKSDVDQTPVEAGAAQK